MDKPVRDYAAEIAKHQKSASRMAEEAATMLDLLPTLSEEDALESLVHIRTCVNEIEYCIGRIAVLGRLAAAEYK